MITANLYFFKDSISEIKFIISLDIETRAFEWQCAFGLREREWC